MRWMPLLTIALLACAGEKIEDNDGDGVGTDLDCDDKNPDIKPSAPELCDGIDNNCNDEVDEGVGATFWADADGDTFGDPSNSTKSCEEALAGYVEPGEDEDCNDDDATVNPAADERCDPDVDANCDGNSTAGATDTTTFFADGDGDGYGNTNVSVDECIAPEGYVSDGEDCDDTNNGVNPGAEEVCNNRDDDCDGDLDGGATDAIPFFVDDDNDGYGTSVSMLACSAGVGLAEVDGDCDDTNVNINPGELEECNGGIDDDCDASTEEDLIDGDVWYEDSDNDSYGNALSSVTACVAPSGYTSDDTDCADNSDTVYPGAPETCNGQDDDCDGDDDNDPSDGTVYYNDGDADGYGDPVSGVLSCSALPGSVTNGDDCDDLDSLINPDTVWYEDADGDGYGSPSSTTTSCAQPVGFATDSSDCDDTSPITFPGAYELCDSIDNDCDPTTDENVTALWYQDTDGDGWGNPAVALPGCPQPAGYVEIPGDCDDNDSNLNPDLSPECSTSHCGPIAGQQVWVAGETHTVTCPVIVGGPTNPVLTIEPGAVVLFENGASIEVGTQGRGRLIADGELLGIEMDGTQNTPLAGDWSGIVLGSEDQNSILNNVHINHAGEAGYALQIEGGQSTITNSFIENSLGDGIRVEGGTPEIADNMVSNNFDDGVEILSDGRIYSPSTGRGFRNNIITGNSARPLILPAVAVGEVAASNALAGNGFDEALVTSGTIVTDANWLPLDVPYFVNGTVGVRGTSDPTLAISPGITLEFGTAGSIETGVGETGRLEVNASAAEPVVFTSGQLNPAAGDWDGIRIGSDDSGTSLNYVMIDYAAATTPGALYIDGGSASLSNVNIQNSAASGVYSESGSLVMTDSTVTNSQESGVYIDVNSQLVGNFDNNVITNNLDDGVVVPARSAHYLMTTSDYTGNASPNRVVLLGGNVAGAITTSVSWLNQPGAPYRVDGLVTVDSDLFPVLTLPDAATIYFSTDGELESGTGEGGRFVINQGGTINFTSAASSPSPGDWQGVTLGDQDAGSQLNGLTIEYAGANGKGGLFLDGGTATVSGLTAQQNTNAGVYAEDAVVEINNSTIIDNLGFGIYLDEDTRIPDTAGDVAGGPDIRTFTNNTLTGNVDVAGNDHPLAVNAQWIDELDAVGTYGGGRIVVWGDTITEDATIINVDADYEVRGDDLHIESPVIPVVTVADGVTIYFELERGLVVGADAPGALITQGASHVAGSCDDPSTWTGVLFTSARPTPLAGDWGGVTIDEQDAGSVLDGLTIAYGGSNGDAGLFSDESAPEISNSMLCYNDHAGIRGESSLMSMDNLVVEGTTGPGISFDASSRPVSLTNSTISDNFSPASMVVPAGYASILSGGNTFGDTEIEIITGDVLVPTTLPDFGVPYHVTGDIRVFDSPLSVLVIEPGVEMLFESQVAILVGQGQQGTLQADDVLFTSVEPAIADWDGILFGQQTTGSWIRNSEISWGGNSGALVSVQGEVELSNNEITQSDFLGIEVTDLSQGDDEEIARVELFNNDVHNNDGRGLFVNPGAQIWDANGNNYCDNGLRSGSHAEMIGTLGGDFFCQEVEVTGGDVLTSQTWVDLGVPYIISADVEVQGQQNPVLTLNDGVELRFNNNVDLHVGRGDHGEIWVDGHTLGVLMTSNQPIPAQGDWGGLIFGNDGLTSLIEGLTIEYAGSEGRGAIVVDQEDFSQPSHTINNTTVIESSNAGFFVESGGDAIITDSVVVSSSSFGVWLAPDSAVTLDNTDGNNIYAEEADSLSEVQCVNGSALSYAASEAGTLTGDFDCPIVDWNLNGDLDMDPNSSIGGGTTILFSGFHNMRVRGPATIGESGNPVTLAGASWDGIEVTEGTLTIYADIINGNFQSFASIFFDSDNSGVTGSLSSTESCIIWDDALDDPDQCIL